MRKQSRRITALVTALLTLAVCAGGLSVRADEATETVRMGYFEYGSMCRGAAESAEKSGYVYDFMQKISSYVGWEYTYSYGTYSEEYELLKEGMIDILPYTNKNEEREKEVLFSKNPILEEHYYLAVRNGDDRFAGGDVSCLNGMVIATVTGADQNNLLNDYLTENGVEAQVVFRNDPEDTWDMLENKETDAAVFSSISYRENVDWNVFCSFGSKPTYIAVAKEREDLLEKLDDAFDTLIQTNPTFMSKLEATVSSGNPAMVCLGEKEKEWLDAHDVIRVGYLNNSNLTYVRKEPDGKYSGLVAEMLQRVFSSVNIKKKVQFVEYDKPDDLGKALLSYDIDMAYPLFPSFSYAEVYHFSISNSLTENDMAVIYRQGTPVASAMDSVAVAEDTLSYYYVQNKYPNSKTVKTATAEDAARLVREGKVTGYVGEAAVTSFYENTYGNLEEYILNDGCETCFAARLEDSPLMVIMDRGISSIPDSEITAMIANNTVSGGVDLVEYVKSHTEVLILVIMIPVFILVLVLALTAVNRLRKKAQVASKAKTRFLFNMSHDIRTPMNAILGYTDLALRHGDDRERVEDSLKKIKSSGGHLLNLINDILEMSRIESDKLEIADHPMDVRDAIECINQMGQSLAAPKSIDFITTVGDIKNRYISADELHVNEVLINLISNAVKYTGDSGKVEFLVNQLGEEEDGIARFLFIVKDNGIGMSDEFQEHLFENFSRENNAVVSRQEGAGLGLSIVKKIVDLADGTISVQSKQGDGSVFSVEFPFKVLDKEAEEKFLEERGKFTSLYDDTVLDGKKVLLVEDNEMNREIAEELLTEAGLNVESAENGAIAVDMVQQKGTKYYDFILMDIQMPVMNGYEATKEIRHLPGGGKIPVIALSANAFKEDVEASIKAGMNAHVAKPIDVKILKSTMKSVLR